MYFGRHYQKSHLQSRTLAKGNCVLSFLQNNHFVWEKKVLQLTKLYLSTSKLFLSRNSLLSSETKVLCLIYNKRKIEDKVQCTWLASSLGDSYLLGKDLTSGFLTLTKKYGKVTGLWLGPRRAVVISDFEILQDILNKKEVNDRQFRIAIRK